MSALKEKDVPADKPSDLKADERSVDIASYGSAGGVLGAAAFIGASSIATVASLGLAAPLVGAAIGAGAGIFFGAIRPR